MSDLNIVAIPLPQECKWRKNDFLSNQHCAYLVDSASSPWAQRGISVSAIP